MCSLVVLTMVMLWSNRCWEFLHFAKLKHYTPWDNASFSSPQDPGSWSLILIPRMSWWMIMISSTFWWYVTFFLLRCKNNLWVFVCLTSSCPVHQTEAPRSSAFLHWRRRQWKSRRWLPRYSNRGATPPPLPSPLWAEGSLRSWTGADRRFS